MPALARALPTARLPPARAARGRAVPQRRAGLVLDHGRPGRAPRGHRAAARRTERPCDPDDVVKCLDQLYRHRRIDLVHARILRIWGERGMAPNPAYPLERCDWRLWREALDRLEWPLRVKGIVA